MIKDEMIELETMKTDFLRKAQIAIEIDVPKKIDENLSIQLKQIREECISKFPDSFLTFYEDFGMQLQKEAYELKKRYVEKTTENVESDIFEAVHELLGKAKQKLACDTTVRIEKPDQINKKINYERQENIERALKTAFKNGILNLGYKVSFTSADSEDLLYVIKDIIRKYSQSIEAVFSDTEKEITERQLEKFVQELNQTLEKDKLEWEEDENQKSICPKLTPESRTKFAKKTKQISTQKQSDIVKTVSDLVM